VLLEPIVRLKGNQSVISAEEELAAVLRQGECGDPAALRRGAELLELLDRSDETDSYWKRAAEHGDEDAILYLRAVGALKTDGERIRTQADAVDYDGLLSSIFTQLDGGDTGRAALNPSNKSLSRQDTE
jgi:hypothetical protein